MNLLCSGSFLYSSLISSSSFFLSSPSFIFAINVTWLSALALHHLGSAFSFFQQVSGVNNQHIERKVVLYLMSLGLLKLCKEGPVTLKSNWPFWKQLGCPWGSCLDKPSATCPRRSEERRIGCSNSHDCFQNLRETRVVMKLFLPHKTCYLVFRVFF